MPKARTNMSVHCLVNVLVFHPRDVAEMQADSCEGLHKHGQVTAVQSTSG